VKYNVRIMVIFISFSKVVGLSRNKIEKPAISFKSLRNFFSMIFFPSCVKMCPASQKDTYSK